LAIEVFKVSQSERPVLRALILREKLRAKLGGRQLFGARAASLCRVAALDQVHLLKAVFDRAEDTLVHKEGRRVHIVFVLGLFLKHVRVPEIWRAVPKRVEALAVFLAARPLDRTRHITGW
jgi:hypothetical protein